MLQESQSQLRLLSGSFIVPVLQRMQNQNVTWQNISGEALLSLARHPEGLQSCASKRRMAVFACALITELLTKESRMSLCCPVIGDLLHQVHGASAFSFLDLQSGIIRLQSRTVCQRLNKTPVGYECFRVLSFGVQQLVIGQAWQPHQRVFMTLHIESAASFQKTI